MTTSDKNREVCNESEFESIYVENSKSLKNYLYYLTGDHDRADDHLQNAFIALWKNCAKVGIESAAPYLYRVAKNFFLKEVRHEKVKLNFQKQSTYQNEPSTSSDEGIQLQQFEEALENAISDLTEGQREVFLMSRMEKMKYHEIAEKLGVSVKAIEKRMHKALRQLNEALKEFEIRKV